MTTDNRVSDAPAKEDAESEAVDVWAEKFGVPLPGPVRDDLLKFARLLLLWGQSINLTAAKSVAALVADHLPDAFAIAGRLAGPRAVAPEHPPERVVDVGSGGGLPGIPLALIRSVSEVTLIEATGKKVAFLRTAIRELALAPRVGVEHRRVDLHGGYGRPSEGSDLQHVSHLGDSSHLASQFDVAISRAMLPPAEWLPLGRLLVRPGGRVFCLGTEALTEWPPGLNLVHQAAYPQEPRQSRRWLAELQRST